MPHPLPDNVFLDGELQEKLPILSQLLHSYAVSFVERIEEADMAFVGSIKKNDAANGCFVVWVYEQYVSEQGQLAQYLLPFTELPDELNRHLYLIMQQFSNLPEYSEPNDSLSIPSEYFQWMNMGLLQPLKGISAFANLLRNEYLSSRQRAVYADYISGHSNRILQFFSSILEFYNYRQGYTGLQTETFELTQLLEELQLRYHRILHSQKTPQVRLILSYSPDLKSLTLTNDKRRLISILDLLLETTLHFAQGPILWTSFVDNTKLVIKLSSQGNFTDPKRVPQHDFQKLGIDLLLAHFNSQLLGGFVSIEQQENQTCISLGLPL